MTISIVPRPQDAHPCKACGKEFTCRTTEGYRCWNCGTFEPARPQEVESVDKVPCPWCGYMIGDFWDYDGLHNDGDTCATDCHGCGKPITIRISVAVSYAIEKPKAEV